MKRVPVTQHAPLANDRVSEFAGERPYLATGSVNDDGILAPELVTYESRPSRADLSARIGDVCFARMQATRKVLRIDEASAETILSTGFAVLRPNPEYLYSGYLRSWVASDAFQFAKDRLCTGATQKAITNAKIRTLPIPVPPPPRRAEADCEDSGCGGRLAGQVPRGPRPAQHAPPIHLPRHVWRPRHQSDGAPERNTQICL